VHTQSDNGQFQPLISDINAPLRVKNLKKRFGTLEVLKGISMTAQRGDVISILGSSGSGKSTFLRCGLVDYSVWKAFLESKMVRWLCSTAPEFRAGFSVQVWASVCGSRTSNLPSSSMARSKQSRRTDR
jgi:ABC-type Mn2+/Zn2+ transport system ATPase subunit